MATYAVFTRWQLGHACSVARAATPQAHVCGDGTATVWSYVALGAVVLGIFAPALLLVRLWRRIGPWSLLPVAAATVAVPLLLTVALDLAPG